MRFHRLLLDFLDYSFYKYDACILSLQSFSTTEDDSLSPGPAGESDDDTVSRASERSGPGLQRLVGDGGTAGPARVSGWLKHSQTTSQSASVDKVPQTATRLGEKRPESTLSHPFGDYSKDSLEGVYWI